MPVLLFSILIVPIFAQAQVQIEEAPIKRINTELIMNEISYNLRLSQRQVKRIHKALEKKSQKFDKIMRRYEKNIAEEKKWHDESEKDKQEMTALVASTEDTIYNYLDDAQQELFRKLMNAKAEYAKKSAELKAEEEVKPNPQTNSLEQPAEDKVIAAKKKRVVLKKKGRRKKSAAAGNLKPAGSKRNIKHKISRKTEAELPSVIMPPASPAIPQPAAAEESKAEQPKANVKAGAVPQL